MFSRTGPSNLLNKIQFTFEVVPRPFQTIFRRCTSILAQHYKGVGGREEGRSGEEGRWGGRGGGEGGEVGREEEKPPQVKTRSD